MNPPQVYMCSPSWTPLPPPSPFHPSGSSQCTNPKHPVSCIKPGLATHFILDILHVSMPFSQSWIPFKVYSQSGIIAANDLILVGLDGGPHCFTHCIIYYIKYLKNFSIVFHMYIWPSPKICIHGIFFICRLCVFNMQISVFVCVCVCVCVC